MGVVEQLTSPINEKGCKCMNNYNSTYSTLEKEELGAYVTVELTKTVQVGGTTTTGTTTATTTGTTTATTTGTATATTTGTATATTTGTATATTTGTATATTTGTTCTGINGCNHERTEKEKEEEKAMAKTASETPSAAHVASGKMLYESEGCQGCHGAMGQGESGDEFAPYDNLPRAQSVTGVIEQLVEPLLGMTSYDDKCPSKRRNWPATTSVSCSRRNALKGHEG